MLKANDYSSFIFRNHRLVSFGIIMAFASSFGQTYFIGVFSPAICLEFQLSHTAWSGVYMIGTLISALILPWTGGLIDKSSLPKYVLFVIMGLIGATFFMALVPSTLFLIAGIFFLRQAGQGLMSHTSSTTLARYCFENRGKAIALASLGMAFGEATLPVLAHFSINAVGWRISYLIAGLFTLTIVLPSALFLIKVYSKEINLMGTSPSDRNIQKSTFGDWSRKAVLKDIRFYLLIPAATAPSLIVTGLFFHHIFLAELKNWDAAWFTGSYWVYATGTIIAMLGVGPVIDRISAIKVLPLHLFPMTIGLLLICVFDNSWWAWPYFLLIGFTTGVSHAGMTALWAELYGLKHLGSIKSLSTSIAVFASALGPIVVGFMMDVGISIEKIFLILAAYCFFTSWVFMITLRSFRTSSH